MANLEKLKENLEKRGYTVSCFAASAEANRYLAEKLRGKTVGIGGTVTVQEMGLDAALREGGAEVVWHWAGAAPKEAAVTQAYICSVNGAAETGELVNIDGAGNRVSSTIYGHEELYFVFGTNKVEPDFERALWRARNVAAPINAMRLKRNTPCAAKGDRCYDCASPERICKALAVLWGPPLSVRHAEAVIVDENLGY